MKVRAEKRLAAFWLLTISLPASVTAALWEGDKKNKLASAACGVVVVILIALLMWVLEKMAPHPGTFKVVWEPREAGCGSGGETNRDMNWEEADEWRRRVERADKTGIYKYSCVEVKDESKLALAAKAH